MRFARVCTIAVAGRLEAPAMPARADAAGGYAPGKVVAVVLEGLEMLRGRRP